MKTNYKIILGGSLTIIFGIFIMLIEVYGELDLNILGLDEIFILVSLSSAGLIITGVGLMLEFANRKYEIQ